MTPWLTVVGIGEDGFSGLGKQARRALLSASRIFGSPRQLALLPRCVVGERSHWPSPFSLAPVLALRGEPVCVLASGDPMFYGVGASLARQVPAEELHVLSMPSSCARIPTQPSRMALSRPSHTCRVPPTPDCTGAADSKAS